MRFDFRYGVINFADPSEVALLAKILSAGINCSPLQNTPEGQKVIELIAQMESKK
jgi:hypothetical protein